MAFVPVICTQCGAQLEVDNTQEAAVCKFCGTPFVVEKAINQYNTNITNNFANATVNVQGLDINNLLELAQFSYESKNYSSTLESCDKVLSVDAKNYKAWELKAKCFGWIDSSITKPKCIEAVQMAKKAIEFAPPIEKQNIAGDLQTEVCLQTLGLINMYSNLNSMGQTMYNTIFASFVNTYIEALKFPYVKANVLSINAEIIIKKLAKPSSGSYSEILFYEYIKTAQNTFNQGKPYVKTIEDILKQGKETNEVTYWKDYPNVVIEQKETLLSEIEKEYSSIKEQQKNTNH